jgi:hypothetical protein
VLVTITTSHHLNGIHPFLCRGVQPNSGCGRNKQVRAILSRIVNPAAPGHRLADHNGSRWLNHRSINMSLACARRDTRNSTLSARSSRSRIRLVSSRSKVWVVSKERWSAYSDTLYSTLILPGGERWPERGIYFPLPRSIQHRNVSEQRNDARQSP